MFIKAPFKRSINMEDIQDIFSESTEFGTEKFSTSEDGNYNLNGRPFVEYSETSRIFTLSDVFKEWYLFDSSHEKDIQQFLSDEQLTDIFTESEFMDLLCGTAYLDKELLVFIQTILPFYISLRKLEHINSQHSTKAYLIQHTESISKKIEEIIKQCTITHEEKTKKTKAQYYAAHKEQIAEYGKIYRETHKEEIKERKKQYQITHKDYLVEYRKKYHETHKEEIRTRNKKWLAKNPEYNKKRAQKPQRKTYMKEYHKQYAMQNSETIKKRQHAWYEANKAKCAEQDKQRRQKLRQEAERAKTMCAAYVFLLELRKVNKEQYMKLYTRQQNPLIGMFKVCSALQNSDINQCPLHNPNCGNTLEQNCNQKVLSLPNAAIELQTIAKNLKQR